MREMDFVAFGADPRAFFQKARMGALPPAGQMARSPRGIFSKMKEDLR